MGGEKEDIFLNFKRNVQTHSMGGEKQIFFFIVFQKKWEVKKKINFKRNVETHCLSQVHSWTRLDYSSQQAKDLGVPHTLIIF